MKGNTMSRAPRLLESDSMRQKVSLLSKPSTAPLESPRGGLKSPRVLEVTPRNAAKSPDRSPHVSPRGPLSSMGEAWTSQWIRELAEQKKVQAQEAVERIKKRAEAFQQQQEDLEERIKKLRSAVGQRTTDSPNYIPMRCSIESPREWGLPPRIPVDGPGLNKVAPLDDRMFSTNNRRSSSPTSGGRRPRGDQSLVKPSEYVEALAIEKSQRYDESPSRSQLPVQRQPALVTAYRYAESDRSTYSERRSLSPTYDGQRKSTNFTERPKYTNYDRGSLSQAYDDRRPSPTYTDRSRYTDHERGNLSQAYDDQRFSRNYTHRPRYTDHDRGSLSPTNSIRQSPSNGQNSSVSRHQSPGPRSIAAPREMREAVNRHDVAMLRTAKTGNDSLDRRLSAIERMGIDNFTEKPGTNDPGRGRERNENFLGEMPIGAPRNVVEIGTEQPIAPASYRERSPFPLFEHASNSLGPLPPARQGSSSPSTDRPTSATRLQSLDIDHGIHRASSRSSMSPPVSRDHSPGYRDRPTSATRRDSFVIQTNRTSSPDRPRSSGSLRMMVHDDEKHDRFSSPVPPLPPRVTWNHRQFEPEAENTIRIHEAAFRRGLKNVVGLHVPVAPGLRVKPVDAELAHSHGEAGVITKVNSDLDACFVKWDREEEECGWYRCGAYGNYTLCLLPPAEQKPFEIMDMMATGGNSKKDVENRKMEYREKHGLSADNIVVSLFDVLGW